jgi:hypothetical protein
MEVIIRTGKYKTEQTLDMFFQEWKDRLTKYGVVESEDVEKLLSDFVMCMVDKDLKLGTYIEIEPKVCVLNRWQGIEERYDTRDVFEKMGIMKWEEYIEICANLVCPK